MLASIAHSMSYMGCLTAYLDSHVSLTVIFFGLDFYMDSVSLVSDFHTSGLLSKGTANLTVIVTVALLKCGLETRFFLSLVDLTCRMAY